MRAGRSVREHAEAAEPAIRQEDGHDQGAGDCSARRPGVLQARQPLLGHDEVREHEAGDPRAERPHVHQAGKEHVGEHGDEAQGKELAPDRDELGIVLLHTFLDLAAAERDEADTNEDDDEDQDSRHHSVCRAFVTVGGVDATVPPESEVADLAEAHNVQRRHRVGRVRESQDQERDLELEGEDVVRRHADREGGRRPEVRRDRVALRHCVREALVRVVEARVVRHRRGEGDARGVVLAHVRRGGKERQGGLRVQLQRRGRLALLLFPRRVAHTVALDGAAEEALVGDAPGVHAVSFRPRLAVQAGHRHAVVFSVEAQLCAVRGRNAHHDGRRRGDVGLRRVADEVQRVVAPRRAQGGLRQPLPLHARVAADDVDVERRVDVEPRCIELTAASRRRRQRALAHGQVLDADVVPPRDHAHGEVRVDDVATDVAVLAWCENELRQRGEGVGHDASAATIRVPADDAVSDDARCIHEHPVDGSAGRRRAILAPAVHVQSCRWLERGLHLHGRRRDGCGEHHRVPARAVDGSHGDGEGAMQCLGVDDADCARRIRAQRAHVRVLVSDGHGADAADDGRGEVERVQLARRRCARLDAGGKQPPCHPGRRSLLRSDR
mmetsp:Transcript_22400/g.78484  ORF Transcript_22400/g.78484 Transcript_22400/m.78484 type:complete len:611 (+) Transcript_22400:1020-2852(+)